MIKITRIRKMEFPPNIPSSKFLPLSVTAAMSAGVRLSILNSFHKIIYKHGCALPYLPHQFPDKTHVDTVFGGDLFHGLALVLLHKGSKLGISLGHQLGNLPGILAAQHAHGLPDLAHHGHGVILRGRHSACV